MSTIDLRPTPDAPGDDPHLWLEDIDGEAALAWVERQNARCTAAQGCSEWRRDRRREGKLVIACRRAKPLNFMRRQEEKIRRASKCIAS
jgi:prolyl oligopeptidase PreP (S9A serine peptidase family)